MSFGVNWLSTYFAHFLCAIRKLRHAQQVVKTSKSNRGKKKINSIKESQNKSIRT